MEKNTGRIPEKTVKILSKLPVKLRPLLIQFLQMNKEIQSIAKRIANVISGEPWFGESILSLLREIDPSKTGLKPPGASHNMKALLWHMNTWATFIF